MPNTAISAEPRATYAPASEQGTTRRVASIDVVRGGIMILMALDHVRDYVTNLRIRPEDLARGSAALFATRWITHFCAPGFFLLAGIGIGISAQRSTLADVRRFLVTRGIWLLFLELVVTAIGWQFGFQLVPAFAIVIWALGLSMMLLALVVGLPHALIAMIALLLIGAHNLFDGVRPESLGALAPLWHILHVPGLAIPGKLIVAYPLVPWVGVMALGFVIADMYRWDAARRRKTLLWAGVAATAAFIALRAFNGYGNPFPWSPQRTPALTVASFLNLLKYPPSLQFLLMTLGPLMIALALTENARGRIASVVQVYGRVPLFYYVVHIFLVHALAVGLALMQGGELRRIPVVSAPETIPAWYGVSLPGVYLAWATVVVLMYWPCRWFGRIKAERKEWWLRYL
ncbi:MAG TPA: heparan-alpha-glucosaminide N-acetyltransferase domain-containing protein [Gemmatimonadaceae bacterium]|nr:heparan-alpha-glucosaminide N-acetyltransferase domain-containing protein [Gemmatimonadaceae bacterium]